MSPANLPGLTLPLDHLMGSGHSQVGMGPVADQGLCNPGL